MAILWNDSDRDWQTLGKVNPYFGVLSQPEFSFANLNKDSLEEFFASGERDIEQVYRMIRAHIRPDFQPVRVLDYGCGVGRLVLPLARRSAEAVGIDVSPGMLEQARENCQKYGVSATLLDVSQLDSLAPGSFDLIHSVIVFQHIPVARGERILKKLIVLLADGGVGALHFTHGDIRKPSYRLASALRKRVGLIDGLLNLLQHRPFSNPLMQMNMYSMNRIFGILMDMGCSNLHVEFSDHSGYRTAFLYFQKPSAPLPQ